MRLLPRNSRWWCLCVAFVALGKGEAQSSASGDGALFLLLPVGARAAAIGQAVTAVELGGESVWWNPAALASLQRPEALLHHSQSIIGRGDAVTMALPIRLVGVVALSASTINFGEQELGTDPGGATGILVPRSFVFAATYASSLGSSVRAGLTYKMLQLRADCSGSCQDFPSFSSASSALDFGVQFSRPESHPFSYGISVRNVGPRLQVVDTEQADALPSRLYLGVEYRLSVLEQAASQVRLRLLAEIYDRLKVSRPNARLGAELQYHERLFLRGGHVFEEGGGASLGAGFVAGNLSIDLARILGGVAADIGEPPTFISLRLRFR
jgi:hypothetical protein